MTINVSVRMPENLITSVDQQAAAQRRTRSAMLILLLEQGLAVAEPTLAETAFHRSVSGSSDGRVVTSDPVAPPASED
jgi:hypothetical protein